MNPTNEYQFNIDASETLDDLMEISQLLNCNLSRDTLGECVSMCEQGANPEALVAILLELEKYASAS